MKRFLSFILCLILMATTFSGCSSKPKSVRIAGVTNSPYAQLSHMLEKNEGNSIYASTTVNLPNRIRNIMSEGGCDVAVVPVETACAIYSKKETEIKIIAGISVGGFELVTTEEITEIKSLKNKTVYLTERNTLMASILEYLIKLHGLEMNSDVKFEYANDLGQLKEAFNDKTASFALLTSADAALIKSEVNGINSYNLTDELAKKFKNPSIITYCVIGTTEFIEKNEKIIEELLKDIEASVSNDNDFEETIKLGKKHSILTDDIYGKEFLEALKPKFISGKAMKEKLEAYFKMIKKIKPTMVNRVIGKEDLFYISEE